MDETTYDLRIDEAKAFLKYWNLAFDEDSASRMKALSDWSAKLALLEELSIKTILFSEYYMYRELVLYALKEGYNLP